ncbi:hypothetical protein SI65_02632 [Aspergillus cristatus]|uniref:Carrier domain-containing protein n=1 Tax=Aspergillus cristatus TaxID=573508 RepID=A0A1E3BLK6_ASPCR|nr:hypothetical protein SI65_02632 [Aspergillus cristatus]
MIATRLLARAFWEDRLSRLCARALLADSFSGRQSQEGARLYRTGDLASIVPDGTLHGLGRQDLQVKLRGQRIDLLAVQHHVFHSFPGARDVMAEVISCSGQPEALMAFVVSSDESTDSEQSKEVSFLSPSTEFSSAVRATQAQLQLELPPYAVPSIFIPIAHMPLNENGKANRRHIAGAAACLSPDQLRSYQGMERSIVPPDTDLQRQVREIWSIVLRVEPEIISIHDNSFRIGGNSITCMQIAYQCKSIGLQATAADIWQYTSIAGLASHCSLDVSEQPVNKTKETTWDELSPIQATSFERNPHGDDHFDQGFTIRLKVPVEPKRVQTAIRRLVETHSMLRARFQQFPSGTWCQRITDDVGNSFDSRECSVADEAALPRFTAVSHEALNIREGPLYITDLIYREDNDQQYLSLVAHHLVVDSVSWWVMLADLEELLRGASTILPASNPSWTGALNRLAMREIIFPLIKPFRNRPIMIRMTGNSTMQHNTGGFSRSLTLSQRWLSTTLPWIQKLQRRKTPNIPLASKIHGCLLHSFAQVFEDRPVPTVLVESHGREPWNRDIDLTRTVGWFTTLWPAYVSIQREQSISDVIRKTQESRNCVPNNGWAYFASRYLNPEGRSVFHDTGPLSSHLTTAERCNRHAYQTLYWSWIRKV